MWFFRFFSVWPLWLLHPLGAVLGWLAFAASPAYRQRLRAHVRQAGYGGAVLRAAVGHAGRLVAELPRLWLGRPLPCRIHNEASALRAYAAGRGVIFLTPHLGCFELSVQEGARRWARQYGPITILYRPARQRWLAALMQATRSRSGVHAVPTTLAGVRQMAQALRRGGAIGLLPDQVPPQGQGVWVPFFGRPAYTMTLAARLARQSGAAVIVARCQRLPWGRGHALYLEELPMPPAPHTLEAAVAHINAAMQRCIAHCPQQYLWGYARYRQPRIERTTAPEAAPASGAGA